jgi:hypothetical protein
MAMNEQQNKYRRNGTDRTNTLGLRNGTDRKNTGRIALTEKIQEEWY